MPAMISSLAPGWGSLTKGWESRAPKERGGGGPAIIGDGLGRDPEALYGT